MHEIHFMSVHYLIGWGVQDRMGEGGGGGSGYGVVTNIILKEIAVSIGLIINHVNNSGIFADKPKFVEILSLFRKGDKANIIIREKYRPISLLPRIAILLRRSCFIK